ncbi:hypothetical protein FZEAL_3443 [Fusarium zealandicum]|uniref:J domain-containing protein n=1 Tax=Fusarium zealandicum TaxID=1053134 RepID=A0A8H4UNU7_9HYPO|nr:hypothetical protein FZEAL_3443 [Fusarium zealandicum]
MPSLLPRVFFFLFQPAKPYSRPDIIFHIHLLGLRIHIPSMSAKIDYYAVLGLSQVPVINDAVIKQAYRRLARESHPDKDRYNPRATRNFQVIVEAYETLIDTEKREAYHLHRYMVPDPEQYPWEEVHELNQTFEFPEITVSQTKPLRSLYIQRDMAQKDISDAKTKLEKNQDTLNKLKAEDAEAKRYKAMVLTEIERLKGVISHKEMWLDSTRERIEDAMHEQNVDEDYSYSARYDRIVKMRGKNKFSEARCNWREDGGVGEIWQERRKNKSKRLSKGSRRFRDECEAF